MDEDEDLDIAATMGFGSFGGTKKRKYEQSNSPKHRPESSGANTTKLGVRTKKTPRTDSTNVTLDQGAVQVEEGTTLQAHLYEPTADAAAHRSHDTRGAAGQSSHATEMLSFGGVPISRAELNSLRFGVKNERGDTTYFLPSFVEDPWAKLSEGRT